MTAATENKTQEKRDYRSTLNITLKDSDPGAFPQRGNLPAREPEILKRWEAIDLYRTSVDRPAKRGEFVLHDGPPYSNGDIHLGHTLNKTAKDIVTRFKTMQGYRAPYVPGWDNHGMPIENAVARAFREQKRTVDRVALRQACREYAARWVDVQRAQFQRLGVRGDWANPYLTMSREFEATIVSVFGELAERGFIYRGLRPVLWCGTCETALADAEVEYGPHTSNSIYVRFPLWQDPVGVFNGFEQPGGESGSAGEPPAYAVIWTTTPWTIPANLALAVHPDAEYGVVRATVRGETASYLVAAPLVAATMQAIGAEEFAVVKTLVGVGLTGLVFKHPLFARTSPVLLADYVTMDAGTGIVHTAPGHGKEDFETGQKYGIEVLCPVDASGRYTAAAGEAFGHTFEGLRVSTVGDKAGQESEADRAVIEALEQSGNLLRRSAYEHSYPHCWRCHSPLIFRATVQWFMNIDHERHREKALQAIDQVTWYPPESINRIKGMVAGRPDWCVSRQRAWGVGIPAFYCSVCGEHILTPAAVAAVHALVLREGSDAWYTVPPERILPADFRCPHCGAAPAELRKETDVLDVWFDSGSTNRAVLENTAQWPDLRWPADMYLEGGDQHRGYFNSSLMIGVATKGSAPYRSVVTNGWTLDESGHAMHKSLGNVVNPLTVIEKYGADILRWWVASTDFKEDVGLGETVLKQVAETYRRVRNTFRFLINNLYDFDPTTDAVPEPEMEDLDRWALARLNEVVRSAVEGYNAYEFHRVYHAVHNFCAVDLSAFYLDVLKDRLYASAAPSRERRSAQTALHRLAETLARLLAPLLVFTSEEVWNYVKLEGKAESVHLAPLPEPAEAHAERLERWSGLFAVRERVKKALEEARQSGAIGNPLEARVDLETDEPTFASLAPFRDQLATLFLVSQVTLRNGRPDAELEILVGPAEGEKCPRCWLVKRDIGAVGAHPDLCRRCAGAVEQKC